MAFCQTHNVFGILLPVVTAVLLREYLETRGLANTDDPPQLLRIDVPSIAAMIASLETIRVSTQMHLIALSGMCAGPNANENTTHSFLPGRLELQYTVSPRLVSTSITSESRLSASTAMARRQDDAVESSSDSRGTLLFITCKQENKAKSDRQVSVNIRRRRVL